MWTEQAEELIEATTETGLLAAEIVAAAWRNGVDPAATNGLAKAALILGAEPVDLLRGGLKPLPNDMELLIQAADLETDTANHRNDCLTLAEEVTRALDTAILVAGAAAAQARAAKTSAEAHKFEKVAARAAGEIADCETALELLTAALDRLTGALDHISRAPDDLTETYELPYAHIRRGGTLPDDSRFLTGVPA